MEKNRPILLVEDDRIDILTVQRGFQVLKIENPLLICYNGQEAYDLLENMNEKEYPALILLDLNLPKVDGFQFLRKLKGTPLLKRIPTIVVTTSNSDSDKTVCYDLNIAGYFVKPLDYFTLLNSIMQYWQYCKLPPVA